MKIFSTTRPDFTPHSTDSGHLQSSRAFVDAALPAMQTPLAGTHRDYLAQRGDQHRLELPLYTGENFDLNPFSPALESLAFNNSPPKQDITFDFDAAAASFVDAREDQRQLQCYQRLKSLYEIVFFENDMPHNSLVEDELK